jgi:hypothetical protein
LHDDDCSDLASGVGVEFGGKSVDAPEVAVQILVQPLHHVAQLQRSGAQLDGLLGQ